MILKLLLDTRIICKMSMKTSKSKIQEKKQKLLIVFDDMITDVISNIKLSLIVTVLFNRGRKLNISLVLFHNHTLKYLKTKHYTLLYYDIIKQNKA